MKKLFTIGFLLVATTLLVTGFGSCGKKAAEKTIESSIEKSTGGQVDVDVDKDSVKIETNEGTFESGENVSLPSGFPSDVYVVDGTVTSATSSAEDAYTVTIETSKSVNAVKELYESKLASDGWDISMTMTFEDSATLGGEKDDRTVTVSIGEDSDGKTFVILGVGKSY